MSSRVDGFLYLLFQTNNTLFNINLAFDNIQVSSRPSIVILSMSRQFVAMMLRRCVNQSANCMPRFFL